MEFELAYGKEKIRLALSDNFDVDIFAPAIADKYVTFESFKANFKKEGGDKFLSGEKLLFIVNDGFRNTPTGLILKWLDIIDTTFIKRVHFIVSTGTHKEPTIEHYQSIFGNYYLRLRNKITYHDARDYSLMVKIGVDKFGADVWVNKTIFEYDKVCLIGSVEPHYFAGYTGGRKSIFPGLTDFATVERNHNLANSLEAAPLKLKANPVAEHLSSLMSLLDFSNYFSFQTVLDAKQQLASIFMGDVYTSFEKAAVYAEKIYAHNVDQEYDIVICELLSPLDDNLYQAQKALENCQTAVKDGGTVIVVSACEGGIGSQHFWDLAQDWNREKNISRDNKFHFGSHKLSRVNSIAKRIKACLYSTLKEDVVRRVFFEPINDIKIFLNSLDKNQEKYKLAIVNDAGHTVLKGKI